MTWHFYTLLQDIVILLNALAFHIWIFSILTCVCALQSEQQTSNDNSYLQKSTLFSITRHSQNGYSEVNLANQVTCSLGEMPQVKLTSYTISVSYIQWYWIEEIICWLICKNIISSPTFILSPTFLPHYNGGLKNDISLEKQWKQFLWSSLRHHKVILPIESKFHYDSRDGKIAPPWKEYQCHIEKKICERLEILL